MKSVSFVCASFLLICLTLACRPQFVPVEITVVSTAQFPTSIAPASTVNTAVDADHPLATLPATLDLNTPVPSPTPAVYSGTPTPDPLHLPPEGRAAYLEYTVKVGDTLGIIAQTYNSSITEIMDFNGLSESDFIQSGQVLRIPTEADIIGPSIKIIPDSELIYGPTVKEFQVRDFLSSYHNQSALLRYVEVVEGRELGGPEVVELVALRYSVNPRLLLAAIEHRTGWVTQYSEVEDPYMMGFVRSGFEGLYLQLGWAANRMNAGYYGRAEGGQTTMLVEDGTRVAFAADINHATAGIQNWLGAHSTASYESWQQEVTPSGFFATYNRLFGNPFGYTYEPILPITLSQPNLELPWEPGVPWYYTGGPHGGWAGGSAWAALDFAPDADQRGCYVSETWITAASSGRIMFSDMGGVLVDMDGDGDIGTGWVIVYWHVDAFERIPAGQTVTVGDRIGHASCEGGYSNGTHLHFARRYNGRWISADGLIPFELSGWTSEGLGQEYDGYLRNGDQVREACVCAEEINELIR